MGGTKWSTSVSQAVRVERSDPDRVLDPEGKANSVTVPSLRNITDHCLLQPRSPLSIQDETDQSQGQKPRSWQTPNW